MPTNWCIRLLGPVSVLMDGQAIDLGGPTARAVLAALALAGATGAGVPELVHAVWGGPGEASRESVYHYVKKLRTRLADPGGPHVVRAANGRYSLVTPDDVVDWHNFQRLAARGRRAQESRDADIAVRMLEAALAQWHGPPLGDIGDRLLGERHRLAERRLTVIETLAGLEAARHRAHRVYDLLAGELSTSPHRERMALMLIEALAALGRREEAATVFHQTRRHLKEHLGLDPSSALLAAYRATLEIESRGAPPPPARLGPKPAREGRPVPSGLPRPDRHFTGRSGELATICSVMTSRADPICVISGLAGIGKTALATRAAAALADQYPDGCLFLDLAGHSPAQAPLEPADALDRLLRRLGVVGNLIPPEPDERSALFRGLLSERRMLVVLDDCRDVAQVLPLLPGAPGGGVIVTSRRQLAALDDAFSVVLAVLPEREASTLFRSIVGVGRLRGEPAGMIERIVARCGCLPLAIRIAAARHLLRQPRTLADLDAELADAESRLAHLDDGQRSVGTSLAVSLGDLPEEASRCFALLALHVGPDISLHGAAALLGRPLPASTRTLDQLAERHLLSEHRRGRYRWHDLVAAFARAHALPAVPATERAAAQRRILDFYVRAADAADTIVTPHRFRIPLQLVDESATLPPLADYDAALAWLNTEQVNLTAMCLMAGEAGLDASCWQLAFTLRGYFFLAKLWQPWLTSHRAALAAAQRSQHLRGEAVTQNNLGLAYLDQAQLDLADEHCQESIRLFRQVGDTRGEHTARANRAWVLFARRRHIDFLRELHAVLDYYRRIGSEHNVAITLRGIGLAETELDRCSDAVAHLTEALDIVTRLDVPLDITMTLNAIGEAHKRGSDTHQARAAFERALAASERSGSVYERARARHRLGDLARADGRIGEARAHWAHALADYRQLGAAQCAEVEAKLST